MDKKYLVGVGLVLVLALGVIFPRPIEIVKNIDVDKIVREIKESLGAFPGPDVYQHVYLNSGYTAGGRKATTSPETISTYTLVRGDFRGEPTYYDWLPNRQITLTIGATSTHGYIPKVGDVANIYFRNASSSQSASAKITFVAADSGLDLQFTEATGGDLVLNGLDWAKLTFIRESVHLVTVIFDEFTEAD